MISLWTHIPAAKGQGSVILWALFGNDEDGICGERSGVPTFGGVPCSTRQFIRWWLRNPFHNLSFHVLAWHRTSQLVLLQIDAAGVVGLWNAPPAIWPVGRGIKIALAPALVSFRLFGVEGYFGWRERGNLGLALRRSQGG